MHLAFEMILLLHVTQLSFLVEGGRSCPSQAIEIQPCSDLKIPAIRIIAISVAMSTLLSTD